MTKLYKLTTLEGKTYNQTQWGENITHAVPIRDAYELCSPEVLHAYISPEMAVLMDPIQADLLPSAILWECEGDVVIDDGTKVGCTSITTLRQVSLPVITLEQRVTFAIRCAMQVYKDAAWTTWAQTWLKGLNRTAAAAHAAADAYDAAAAAAAVMLMLLLLMLLLLLLMLMLLLLMLLMLLMLLLLMLPMLLMLLSALPMPMLDLSPKSRVRCANDFTPYPHSQARGGPLHHRPYAAHLPRHGQRPRQPPARRYRARGHTYMLLPLDARASGLQARRRTQGNLPRAR